MYKLEMSLNLTRENLLSTGDDGGETPNIFDALIYTFEELSDEGINSVQNLYNRGLEQSSEIEYLWDLMVKLDETQTSDTYTFTGEEIDELNKQIPIILTLRVPQYLKDALLKLQVLVKPTYNRRMTARITAKELEGLRGLVKSGKLNRNSSSVVGSFLSGNTGTLKGQQNKQKQKFGIPLVPRARKNRKTRKTRRNRRTNMYKS
jgi:hypothetical protein